MRESTYFETLQMSLGTKWENLVTLQPAEPGAGYETPPLCRESTSTHQASTETMQPITRPLLLLHSDKALRERVHRASRQWFDVRQVTTWANLRETAQESAPGALAVVDPYQDARDGSALSPALHAFLLDFPSAAVVAALHIRLDAFRDLRTLGAWGVADILSLDQDATPASITHLLLSVSGRRLAMLLDESLPAAMPGRARAILTVASDVVSRGGHASDLANALQITRRTLLRWCEDAGLPPPRRIMTWMRLLLAAEMLDEPGRTVSSIAFACGYASDTALRTALNAQLGKAAKELRRAGAFATAAEAFREEIRSTQRRTGTSTGSPG